MNAPHGMLSFNGVFVARLCACCFTFQIGVCPGAQSKEERRLLICFSVYSQRVPDRSAGSPPEFPAFSVSCLALHHGSSVVFSEKKPN